jgi:hypothetical protein
MTLQFTPQEFDELVSRLSVAAAKRSLAVVEAVRHSPPVCRAPDECQKQIEKAMLGALEANPLPNWRELL